MAANLVSRHTNFIKTSLHPAYSFNHRHFQLEFPIIIDHFFERICLETIEFYGLFIHYNQYSCHCFIFIINYNKLLLHLHHHLIFRNYFSLMSVWFRLYLILHFKFPKWLITSFFRIDRTDYFLKVFITLLIIAVKN